MTTKAVDLTEFAKEEQERLAAERGLNNGGQAGRGDAPGGRGGAPQGPQIAGVTRQYNYTELVAYWGGLAPMHLAARQGQIESVKALIDAGADVNQRGAGDPVTPLLIATMNGHFDLAKYPARQGRRSESRAEQRRRRRSTRRSTASGRTRRSTRSRAPTNSSTPRISI